MCVCVGVFVYVRDWMACASVLGWVACVFMRMGVDVSVWPCACACAFGVCGRVGISVCVHACAGVGDVCGRGWVGGWVGGWRVCLWMWLGVTSSAAPSIPLLMTIFMSFDTHTKNPAAHNHPLGVAVSY